MDSDGTVLGVAIAVIGAIASVLVAKVSSPRPDADGRVLEVEEPRDGAELRVSPEIWKRFAVLEAKVDRLTAIVEAQKEKVTRLERLLRMAMRIIRRANRRLTARQELPEEIPRELIPYSID
ncbi:hypothetical protein PV620_30335 [Streptomyces sp. ME02-6978a]|uniref:hypothetical protein n=1 Tax=unclassified Streptomyces TaxID=2593676 RepID=UPI0029A800D3|nr:MULTISPECIES: hypothetical protein [unclassified Streptomyces]MDX3087205.1 hypothetical protein [Streptomyces sp. ME12-02E]MDX3335847.1 hypothetical protein [Streptomyces sp. ME02-6978a]